MKKYTYFHICLSIIIPITILTLLAFLYMNRSPVAFALDVETHYVNEEESKDIPYAKIPIAYFAPATNVHNIDQIHIETDQDDVQLYGLTPIRVNGEASLSTVYNGVTTKNSYGFYTLYELTVNVNIEKLGKVEGAIHITSIAVDFSNGKHMDIPIKQVTLLPLRDETFIKETIDECPAFTIVQRHIDHPIDMYCEGERMVVTQPYLKKNISFWDVVTYVAGGGSL